MTTRRGGGEGAARESTTRRGDGEEREGVEQEDAAGLGAGTAAEDSDVRIRAAKAGQVDRGDVRCRSRVQRTLRAANAGSPAAGPWVERGLAFTQDERPGGGVARTSKVLERGLMVSRCRTAKSQPRIQFSARSWHEKRHDERDGIDVQATPVPAEELDADHVSRHHRGAAVSAQAAEPHKMDADRVYQADRRSSVDVHNP